MAITLFSFISGFILSWVTIYFSGLAALSPWFYALLPLIGIIYGGTIVSFLWGGFLLFSLPYKKVKCTGKGNMFFQRISYYFTKMLLTLSWSRLKYHNLRKIPKHEPCLYIFNHTSFVDCWMLIATIHPHRFSIVALNKMKEVPLMGNLATALGCIFIDKDDPNSSIKMIDTAVDYIKNQNTSIAISPEGKVNREKNILSFKNGPFTIAKRSNCPIVLLDFKGIKELDLRKNVFQKVQLETSVIDVIYPETYNDMSTKQLAEYCQNIYQDYLGEK